MNASPPAHRNPAAPADIATGDGSVVRPAPRTSPSRTAEAPLALRRIAIVLAGAALALLAGTACALSFDDLRNLAVAGRAEPDLAYLYPAAFDILLIVALVCVPLVRGGRFLVRLQVGFVLLALLVSAAAASVITATGTTVPGDQAAVVVALLPWVMLAVGLWLLLILLKHVRTNRTELYGPADARDLVPFDRETQPISSRGPAAPARPAAESEPASGDPSPTATAPQDPEGREPSQGPMAPHPVRRDAGAAEDDVARPAGEPGRPASERPGAETAAEQAGPAPVHPAAETAIARAVPEAASPAAEPPTPPADPATRQAEAETAATPVPPPPAVAREAVAREATNGSDAEPVPTPLDDRGAGDGAVDERETAAADHGAGGRNRPVRWGDLVRPHVRPHKGDVLVHPKPGRAKEDDKEERPAAPIASARTLAAAEAEASAGAQAEAEVDEDTRPLRRGPDPAVAADAEKDRPYGTAETAADEQAPLPPPSVRVRSTPRPPE